MKLGLKVRNRQHREHPRAVAEEHPNDEDSGWG